MTRKRRMFDLDLPKGAPAPEDTDFPAGKSDAPEAWPEARHRPMATAVGETGALADELVRLKKLGLVTDLIPVDAVRATQLVRDRRLASDLALDDLKASLRSVGLSNPIRVVADGTGGFELVQGLRRLTAYRQLWAETGDDRWAMIPAGLMEPGGTRDILYRRMVDENLVRKDVSLAEMANLARAYAEDGVEGCTDLDEAVNRLYASAGPQKRSYVRRFAFLMRALEKHLEHPAAIPRALGLQLADRIEAEPGALAGLAAQLRAEGPARGPEDELAVLRRFAAGQAAPRPGRTRGAARRGRISLAVPVGPGVRATATAGKVELRAEMDFTTLDRTRLEAAIEAFFAALARR